MLGFQTLHSDIRTVGSDVEVKKWRRLCAVFRLVQFHQHVVVYHYESVLRIRDVSFHVNRHAVPTALLHQEEQF